MRKAKLILGIALILLLVVAGAVWLLLDANRFRGEIQARLEDQLQRKVTLGNMSLGLIPFRLSVEDLSIAEDPSFASKLPFTQTEVLDVRVSLFPLLRGSVQIDSIELVKPSVELIRNAEGVWNFSSLSQGAKGSAGPSGPDSPAPAASAGGFTLSRLSIRDGKVAITDLQKKQPRAVYDHIDISLRDYKAGQPFSFDVAAHLPGSGSQEIKVTGTGGPLPDAGPSAMPLKATVTLKEIEIAGLRKFLDTQSLPTTEGTLTGESQIESTAGKMSAKGKLHLEKAKVSGVELGYPLDLDYDLASDLTKGILQITSATLKLGPTPLSVTGSINTNATPVGLNLQVRSAGASITELARLASAFGVGIPPGTSVAGTLSTDVHAQGSTEKPALSGTVSGRDLVLSTKELPQGVQIRALDLALTPAEIRSNEFDAKSGQTTVHGRFAVREYSSKSPVIDLALRAPGATLPEIQMLAKAYGMKGLDQLSGQGKLDFDLRASGSAESMTAQNLIKGLNGNLNLNFDTMKILGFDAMGELGKIGGFLKSDQPDRGLTEVLRLAGHVAVKNGVAETNDLEVRIPEATLAVAGVSNLADESLDLRANAVFSKAFSDKVGGTRVGGYLTTALSNKDGEIVIPAIISGNFQKPKFAPDTKAFLKMQQQRLLPGLDNPRAALSGLLDSLKKKPADPAAEVAPAEEKKEEKKADSLKGVLQGILGGKK